ncbi:hypothetical protein ACFE04_026647 [Oxalis oulophora]
MSTTPVPNPVPPPKAARAPIPTDLKIIACVMIICLMVVEGLLIFATINDASSLEFNVVSAFVVRHDLNTTNIKLSIKIHNTNSWTSKVYDPFFVSLANHKRQPITAPLELQTLHLMPKMRVELSPELIASHLPVVPSKVKVHIFGQFQTKGAILWRWEYDFYVRCDHVNVGLTNLIESPCKCEIITPREF